MSFTDLMSSARGPGLIGMALAIIVLCGFGVLAMFSLEERFQGGGMPIESIIKKQAKDIESLTSCLSGHRKTMEGAAALRACEKKLELAKRDRLFMKDKIEGLQNGLSQVKDFVAAKTKEIEDYKDQYRELVRSKAKGQKLGRLEACDGTVYESVSIREVSAIGMHITYEGGLKCVPFEELPAEMQEQFQFDPNQKKAALAKENEDRAAHYSSVDTSLADAKIAADQQRKLNAQKERETALQAITAKQARVTSMELEIRQLQNAISLEANKRISNAPQLKLQLANKVSDLAKLRSDIARLNAGL